MNCNGNTSHSPFLFQEAQLIPSVVDTEQQSLVVVKKLLAIAVSTITYLRGLFPEKAYGSKYVEGKRNYLAVFSPWSFLA